MKTPSAPTETAWTRVNIPANDKQGPRIEFHFAPAFINALLHREPARTLRERGLYDDLQAEQLVLSDTISVDGSSMFVQAWFISAAQTDRHHLRVSMTAPEPLKQEIHVRLYWDKQEYTTTVEHGEWFFEDITGPIYPTKDGKLPTVRVRLSFEFGADKKKGKR